MEGDAGGLVEQQQVVILVQHVQREVHWLDVGVLTGEVGHIGAQQVAGAGHGPDGDGCAVQGDGAAELQAAQQAVVDVPQTAEQLLDGKAVLVGGDGMGQQAHGAPPL